MGRTAETARSVRVVGPVEAGIVRAAESYVARHRITEDVVRDALAAGHPLESVAQMDEFTIDLVFRFEDAWLVYDTT